MSLITRKRTDRRQARASLSLCALTALTVAAGFCPRAWAGLPERRTQPDRRATLSDSRANCVDPAYSNSIQQIIAAYEPSTDRTHGELSSSPSLPASPLLRSSPTAPARADADLQLVRERLNFPQNHLAYVLLSKSGTPSPAQLKAALAEDLAAIRNQEAVDQASLARFQVAPAITWEYARQESDFLAQLSQLARQKCSRTQRQLAGQESAGDLIAPPTRAGVAQRQNRVPAGWDALIIEEMPVAGHPSSTSGI